MKVAVLKEGAGETRVAAIPETVKKFAGLGATIAVEKGAGESASISDAQFEEAGAATGTRAEVLKDADVILCIGGPDPSTLGAAMVRDHPRYYPYFSRTSFHLGASSH